MKAIIRLFCFISLFAISTFSTSADVQSYDRWWADMSRASIQRIRPEYTDAYLNNPHKGVETFQRFEGDPLYPGISWDDSKGPVQFKPPKPGATNHRYPPTRIAYARWLWSVLEPEKGEIRYDIIDDALKAAAERGQTLRMRTQPFINKMSPDWYWETGAAYDKRIFEEKGIKVPDHNDPLYIKHWGDHIRALGKHYDGHPNLESFDMAYGGNWGEGGGNASDTTAAVLMDIYMEAFQKTQLIAMLDTPGGEYIAKHTDRKDIGWRLDCFGDLRKNKGYGPAGYNWNHMLEFYPYEILERGYKDRWKTAPVVMETCATVAYWHREGFNLEWIIRDGYLYHTTSFIPKSVYIPDEWMDDILQFAARIGYRFFIHNMRMPTRAKAGENVTVPVVIDNRGSAPIYRDYRFALKFTQGDESYIVPFKKNIRTWLPGYSPFKEYLKIPEALKPGTVKFSSGIINDRDEAVVKMAIKAIDKDNWHPLGVMDITE